MGGAAAGAWLERRRIPGPGKVFSEVKRAGKSGPARGGGCGARGAASGTRSRNKGSRGRPPEDLPAPGSASSSPGRPGHRPGVPIGVAGGTPLTSAALRSRSRPERPCPTAPGSQAGPPRECASPNLSPPWVPLDMLRPHPREPLHMPSPHPGYPLDTPRLHPPDPGHTRPHPRGLELDMPCPHSRETLEMPCPQSGHSRHGPCPPRVLLDTPAPTLPYL